MNKKQLSELNKIMKINSWTRNKSGVDKVGQEIIKMCQELDLNWEITESEIKGNLYAGITKDWDGESPTILLSGHIDTVFDKNWTAKQGDEIFNGPGTLDMKAGVLVIVETLRELQRRNELKNLIVLLTPDEEDGMEHIDKQIEYYKRADYAMVFEEGAWNHQDPKARERALVISRKALSFYEVRFKGEAGHNAKLSTKPERKSAILAMAEVITELEKLADYEQGTLINTGIISSPSSAANMIAEEAYMKIDIRYGNRHEVERVTAEIEKVFAKDRYGVATQAKRVLFYPSFDRSEQNIAFADQVIKMGKELKLDIKKQERSSGSEANWIAYGNPDCLVLDGFGVIGTGDHSEQEFFYIESFQQSIDLAVKTILEISK